MKIIIQHGGNYGKLGSKNLRDKTKLKSERTFKPFQAKNMVAFQLGTQKWTFLFLKLDKKS
jgi:hypothetical protein